MRILVVKLTSLGDVIHTLPAVSDASNLIKDIQIDWLVEESFRAIPRWHPSVSTIYTAASRRWRKQPWKFLSEIRVLSRQISREPYDLVIDAQGLLKSALLARMAKGKHAGYDKLSIKETLASQFYNLKLSVNPSQHAVIRTRHLFAKSLGYKIDETICYGLDRCQFSAIGVNDPYLVFLHGTTWKSKQWPVQYWQQLCDMAVKNNFKIKLLWGNNNEYQRAVAIAEGCSNTEVCPKMNLDEIAGVISNARAVVAVDTGLGHLAAALSVPCVSLYGATDSGRTGTIGDSQKHLQAEFECSPCLSRECLYTGQSEITPACFGQFSPQMVWNNVLQLI